MMRSDREQGSQKPLRFAVQVKRRTLHRVLPHQKRNQRMERNETQGAEGNCGARSDTTKENPQKITNSPDFIEILIRRT
jgi:hypothetical protein